jgi:hypothetical protein
MNTLPFMFKTPVSQNDCAITDPEHETLQQYVHALLARQKALDLLDTIQQRINQVWAVMRRLLDHSGAPGGATKAVRAARASQAVQAQNSYRSLDKRREECIADLHQAERRANAALQNMVAARPQPASSKNTGFPLHSRARSNDSQVCRPSRRRSSLRVA